ncbi:hypothetical protein [Candidatus Magnetobacterium casense]|uniref:Uncharacterized protein n=1 Tax=Candidatus Magnetobacterium casense TaxID=1455061 RepID=A0ABS6S3K8_9BACT|nr:hypothetical protein [Candidatus Magnetobacterium casensis]MBV6343439.1 hypothetical protein [Candidatus Magnetobacterium casensis]
MSDSPLATGLLQGNRIGRFDELLIACFRCNPGFVVFGYLRRLAAEME